MPAGPTAWPGRSRAGSVWVKVMHHEDLFKIVVGAVFPVATVMAGVKRGVQCHVFSCPRSD